MKNSRAIIYLLLLDKPSDYFKTYIRHRRLRVTRARRIVLLIRYLYNYIFDAFDLRRAMMHAVCSNDGVIHTFSAAVSTPA